MRRGRKLSESVVRKGRRKTKEMRRKKDEEEKGVEGGIGKCM